MTIVWYFINSLYWYEKTDSPDTDGSDGRPDVVDDLAGDGGVHDGQSQGREVRVVEEPAGRQQHQAGRVRPSRGRQEEGRGAATQPCTQEHRDTHQVTHDTCIHVCVWVRERDYCNQYSQTVATGTVVLLHHFHHYYYYDLSLLVHHYTVQYFI